jgi:molybdenum-dependent DNA-binding transcriptional regulator ModE
MQLLKFNQFVNEANISNKHDIVSKLDRIHEIKARLKELVSETKSIEGELKEFDASVKPIFDAMKTLNDKLAITERYVLKITKYGGEGTAVAYGKAVDAALAQVDEAAQAIIKECVRQHTTITSVKHSFEIERVNESKLTDKAKAMLSKLSAKIVAAVNKFKSFFESKIAKIDSANEKLAKMLK